VFGERARLGLIVPSNNTTVEPEFLRMSPEGVDCFATRTMILETDDPEEKARTILAMHARIDDAAREVASLQAHAIGYVCTSGSFLDGDDSDRVVCARLAAATGVPTVTTSTAMVVALRTMGIQRIALATPYIAQVSMGLRAFLEDAGFSIVAHRDLELLSNLAKGRLGPEASEELVRSMDLGDADGVFISCTNWRTIEAVTALERDLGLPVVSSNLATFWMMLALAGALPETGERAPTPARLWQHRPVEIPAFVLP
jgi:maleate cis-trans isomerase